MSRALRRLPLLRNRANVIATAILGLLVAYLAIRLVRWAVVHAVWSEPPGAGAARCHAAKATGACWAVIHERVRFILLGSYPVDQQWRPALACLLFVLLYLASAVRAWWKPWLVIPWVALPLAAIALLRGGWSGLVEVPSDAWGGLPLTFVLSTVGFAAATPPAIALAFGRRSRLPAVRGISIAYIEVIRGVPLITFLFMAALMFPLFVPQGFTVDKLLRAQLAFAMVIAAYLAEVLRGGLQAISRGQYEAAASMGLRFWPAMLLVVLPQAVRVTIPAIVNTFIAFFKDTSLVAVIGLFDLLGTAKAVVVDPKWAGFGVEVYLFVAAVYFAFCYAVSKYSRYLESILRVKSH